MSILTRAEMEARRLSALRLFNEGASKSEVARKLGVTRTSTCRWMRRIEKQGPQGLNATSSPGRAPRLDIAAHADELRAMWSAADRHSQTCSGFARLIEERYNILYHRDHVNRLMRGLGIGKRKRSRMQQAQAQFSERGVR
jgi:transposase